MGLGFEAGGGLAVVAVLELSIPTFSGLYRGSSYPAQRRLTALKRRGAECSALDTRPTAAEDGACKFVYRKAPPYISGINIALAAAQSFFICTTMASKVSNFSSPRMSARRSTSSVWP